LIEIAHILEPEANEMREEKMRRYHDFVEENKKNNESFVEEIN
jgi:hypothetical protein